MLLVIHSFIALTIKQRKQAESYLRSPVRANSGLIASEVVRSGRILNIHFKFKQQDVLKSQTCDVRESRGVHTHTHTPGIDREKTDKQKQKERSGIERALWKRSAH